MKRCRTDKVTRLIVAALVMMVVTAGVATAQVDPDSREFENFAVALMGVQEVQQRVNSEIEAIITQAPLDNDRFMQIHQEVQATGSVPSTVEQAEARAYQEVIGDIGDIQMANQEDMIALVEDAGLSVARFNELVIEVQQDPTLQQALANLQ